MESIAIDTHDLAGELAAAMPPLTAREQRVAISLYRLLAEGRPVPPERLAERAGLHDEEVKRLLESWPGVHLDEAGVVGFWGLALDHMPTAFTSTAGSCGPGVPGTRSSSPS